MARRLRALVVMPGGLTAEEKKKNDLEKAAACRNRIVLDRQSRERAAVGLEAAKRARLGGKEDDGGATGAVVRRPGRKKQVLPGPPYIYTVYDTKVEAEGSAAVVLLEDTRREVQAAADREEAENRSAAARRRETQAAEMRCLSEGVASAQQGDKGAGAEGSTDALREATDGQQDGDSEQAVEEVQPPGGLLPPLSTNRTAEIEEQFAEAKAERKRKYTAWRQHVEQVMGKLEAIIVEVVEKAPQGSRTSKKARIELKALQRLREEEENVAMRDEAHMEEVTRNVRQAAVSSRAAAAEWTAALQDQADYSASAEAGGRLPPQEVAADMEEAAGSQAQAAAGFAPWESVEEMEEDMEDMGRLLEEGEKEDAAAAQLLSATCVTCVTGR